MASRSWAGMSAAHAGRNPTRKMTMTTTTNDNKLSAHTTWLFALGSIATGIGASYALNGLGTKVTAAVYFAIVALGGFASTYLTRAKTGGAILSFLVAGAGA